MDISSLLGTSSIVDADRTKASTILQPVKSGNMFDAILNGAIDNINKTNSYLSDAENAEISFALGETENTHDLMIALQKASTALQYTVAVRDKFLEAYKEIMQMQI
ncbi:MAG: flagellar hook-basal body complex protein FliE [Lachnospiraceae bacterium]|nr:flagellar hook-basal body complex protein FliE [Lachnospiraceae bacterium]